MLRAAAFQPGARVLVTGATGGVGSVLVPLLAVAGMHVIATALPADAPYLRGLGAAEVIDYQTTDVATETLHRHPDGIDLMVNTAMPHRLTVSVWTVNGCDAKPGFLFRSYRHP